MILVSVPHTGTMFLKAILSRAGFNPIQQHCHTSDIFPLLARRPDVVCAPMRHPEKCWRTWRTRGTGSFDEFVRAWERLDRIAERALFLPIDHPDRDEYLSEMTRGLASLPSRRDGVLRTDWEPIGATTGLAETEEKDLSEVMELDVVRRFYA